LRDFVKEHKWELTLLEDPNARIAQQYGIAAIPHLFIIGSDRKILAVHTGYRQGSIRTQNFQRCCRRQHQRTRNTGAVIFCRVAMALCACEVAQEKSPRAAPSSHNVYKLQPVAATRSRRGLPGNGSTWRVRLERTHMRRATTLVLFVLSFLIGGFPAALREARAF
jgi:hypothetical protein